MFGFFSTLEESDSGSSRECGITKQDWIAEIQWCEAMLDLPKPVRSSSHSSSDPAATTALPSFSRQFEPLDLEDEPLTIGDGRNNSAWAWRWFLMIGRKDAEGKVDVEREYALMQIRRIPHNASAWNYLRG